MPPLPPWGGGGGSGVVTAFNTRTGGVTLTKPDVTGTGLAAGDVGADPAGAAAAVQALAALKAANLSDLADAATARGSLGLGSSATHPAADFDLAGAASAVQALALLRASNLSDLASAATARTNLGLKDAASRAISVFDFGVKADTKVFSAGGGVTATSAAFADTTNNPFLPSDTGKTIIIPGAGSGGRGFSTTITYVDAGHVTLAAAAITTVANVGYQFGTDDTANLITAINTTPLLSFAGANHMIVTTVPQPVLSILFSDPTKPNYVLFGHGCSIWQAVGATNGRSPSIFDWRVNDGTTIRAGAMFLDFNFHGPGTAGYTNTDLSAAPYMVGVMTQQWTDVHVVRCKFDGMPGGGTLHRDCRRVWNLHNSCANSTVTAAYNCFGFYDSPTSNANISPQDYWAIGNKIDNCVTGGIVIAIAYSSPAEIRGHIDENTIICTGGGFACIGLEVNSYAAGASTGTVRKVQIKNNIAIQNSTAVNAACIWVADDGGSPVNDPTKLQDILVAGNVCASNSNATAGNGSGAIQMFASRSEIKNNMILATGTSGRCIRYTSSPVGSDASIMTGLDLSSNRCAATNTGATNHLVEIGNTTNWSLLGGRIESSSTTTGDGIKIGSGCQFWTVGGDLQIEAPAYNGVEVIAMKDGKIRNCTIHNANAANTASTANGNGIAIQGAAPTGGYNEVEDCTIIDDRGTHQMLYAALQNGSGATNPTFKNNTMKGALTATTNQIANWSIVTGNVTDTPSSFPAAQSAPAAPASTVALAAVTYPRTVYWYGSTAAVTAVNVTPSGGAAGQVSHTSPGCARLDPGDTIAWTYTVAPTLRIIPTQ